MATTFPLTPDHPGSPPPPHHEDPLRLFTWPKHKPSSWFDLPFTPFIHQSSEPRLITSHGDKHTIAPLFDVRETSEAYFLEGEFHGVSTTEDIKVEWTGPRTISIEANVSRVDLETEWGIETEPKTRAPEEENGRPAEPKRTASGKSRKDQKARLKDRSAVRQWTCERHVGHYLRTFTFPHDVEQESVKARLSQGLLKMMILKKEATKEVQRVPIDITEG
ncbi:hypothetical protein BDV97DRAFT_28385 [Delphinella strobiligena]|nr:hypothetical protein BDV97DRAFT_28385 [Delphinella strobiligena]